MSVRRWLLFTLAGAAALSACGGDGNPAPRSSPPDLSAQVVQLRRDQVLNRIEITLANHGREPVTVDRLQVRIRGYRGGPPVAKDSPIPGGLEVNLPWEYGEVSCPDDSTPRPGRAVVSLRLRVGDQEPVDVRLDATDPDDLVQRIAERTCTVRRVAQEVDLRLGDDWRLDRVDGQKVLHGILRARLLVDQPRDITELAGAIMYGFRPDDTRGPVPDPLAHLQHAGDTADIPVLTYAGRCDGHVKGEIKKPYEFLVWVGPPGDDDPVAVTPAVGEATKLALRQVCAF
jgi:hypothetical protein